MPSMRMKSQSQLSELNAKAYQWLSTAMTCDTPFTSENHQNSAKFCDFQETWPVSDVVAVHSGR